MNYRAVAALSAVLLVLQFPWSVLRAQAPQSGGPCDPPNADPAICGQWLEIPHCTSTPVGTDWLCPPGITGWPWTEAIHVALTYTGKVVLFKNSLSRGAAKSQSRLHSWDPVTQTDQILDLQATAPPYDIFCAGNTFMADGKVIYVGGEDSSPERNTAATNPTGIRAVYIFDPGTATLSRADDLAYQRWYPTPVLLPDRRIIAFSGTQQPVPGMIPKGLAVAESTEAYWPGTTPNGNDSWTSFAARKSNISYYPFMHLLPGPGTRVLLTGPGRIDYQRQRITMPLETFGDLETSNPTWMPISSPSDIVRGGSYARSNRYKILKSGGLPSGSEYITAASVAQAEVISINPTTGQVDSVRLTGTMNAARTEHNLTILADGTVLATGGMSQKSGEGEHETECVYGVYTTEIWDPATGHWGVVAPMTHRVPDVPRMYHSTALLQPDGSVLSAGGECMPDCPEPYPNAPHKWCVSADLYYPPYLMTTSFGIIAPENRPSATNPPKNLAYGEAMSFSRTTGLAATDIPKLALARPGAVTHAYDTDARYIPFLKSAGDFTENLGTGVIDVPANKIPGAKVAPPGYYMLFLLNNNNRPSIAPFVLLWGVVETSVSVTNLVVNLNGTFDITFTWKTTVSAIEGDEIVLIPPPGGSSTPVSQSSSITDGGMTHTWQFKGTCTGGNWTYQVRSKKLRYDSGTTKSISTSVAKTFKIIACIEP